MAKIGEAAHEAQGGGDGVPGDKRKMRPGMNGLQNVVAQKGDLGRKGGNMAG